VDSRMSPLLWMEESLEAELVRETQGGDWEAYRKLVRHYERPVYRLTYALTRRHEDAAELAVETFTRGHAEIGRLPDGKRFLPWLLRFARNLSVTRARRRAEEEAKDGPRLAPRSTTPPTGVELEQRILDALAELRPDEQMALALRICERVSYVDISVILDHSAGVTLSRLSSPRALLLARTRGDAGDAS
jgi:RNA polymerase sigma-70 factor, ECF subfamily